MTRKYLTLLLAAIGGWLLTPSLAYAVAAPAITDADVVRFLNPDQVKQWNEAVKNVADGQKAINEGMAMQKEQPGELGVTPDELTDHHTKGAQKAKDGTTMKNAGMKKQSDLRKIAIAKRNGDKADASATAAASFSANTAQWPEAAPQLSSKLLADLTAQKYTRAYLAGVYVFEDGKYTAKADLTAEVRKDLAAADKDGKIFAAKKDAAIKLAQEGGKLIISYADRAANQKANTKAAVVVGEILYDSHSGYATFSLRGVDLANLHDMANEVLMLSVEPTLGKMLGLADFRVPSKRILPPASKNSRAEPEPPAVTVNLLDPDNFLGKGKQTANAFGVASAGPTDSLANRFAILMLKSYFLDQQKSLKVSDVDFLVLTLSPEKPEDASAKPADVTGAWIVPNVDVLADAMELKSVKARDLAGSSEVTVGPLSIHRDLPKLSLPSTEEMKAGGYTK